MKNFFELFGFLSMACISAAIVFILMGKKDALKGDAKDALTSEYSVVASSPNAPKSVTKGIRDSYSSDSGSARRVKGSAAGSNISSAAAEDRLKSLYNDNDFVYESVKKWKASVADVADEYNVKPQALLANVIVQSYLGGYTRSQLVEDAAEHAGDRVMPSASAAKRYKFAWSVQKIMNQHQLDRYFATEIPTASASASHPAVASGRSTAKSAYTTQSSAPKLSATAKNDPVEEGIKNMVAKEYGFSTWTGLSRLADPEVKAEAQRRVRTLMMAARVR